MMMSKKKIKITLPRHEPEQKPKFCCALCGQMREHWLRCIEGKKKSTCIECINALTPAKARMGWRQYEHFAHRDASVWTDINQLTIILGSAS